MTPRAHYRHAGFSLIDLMIGMVIGIFALLAVALVFRNFAAERNTNIGTLESQSNGTMALYLLERDLGQAGYAMAKLQNCPFISYYYNGSTFNATPLPGNMAGSGAYALSTLPVRIITNNSGSDTLEIQYGNPASGVAGSEITSPVTYPGAYPITSAIGFNQGDLAVADISNQCTLIAVTNNTSPVLSPIAHDGTNPLYNVAAAPGGAGWNNVDAAALAANPVPYLANLGAFVSRRYTTSLTNGLYALRAADFPAYGANSVVDEIVFLKAQYGLSATASSYAVTGWVDGNTAIDNTTASRVVAIRIGVLARSPLTEKAPVNAPSMFSILPPISGNSTMGAPALGQCGTDPGTMEVQCSVPDTHFRYRAYSTIVPLKNVIWSR
ncbi:MAG: PilW family protein [Proteobacteria bacterium]|nr:PilW family protein [Pseudomonadota bacterium]HQR03444.1 PilW family protein [Rhodocyclaceae bacterium]